MSKTHAHGYSSTAQTTHSREDALDQREFERLLEAATGLEDYNGIRTPFAIHVLGRLGLRRGEFCHLKEDWIDWRKEMIRIPRHDRCTMGRDGGPCGMCKQLARQRAARDEEISEAEAMDQQWSAKTDAAARSVYFGFDPRLKLWMDRFFDLYERWEWSAMMINRIVNRCADAADGLDAERVRPHSLRASAASYHAAKGLDMNALLQLMGWADHQTAKVYIQRNETATARKMDAIHFD